MIRQQGTGEPIRVRATYEVIDWLFGDGQTAVRQAMTAVIQGATGNQLVGPELSRLIDKAAIAVSPDVPVYDFISAAGRVAEAGEHGYRVGLRLTQALRRLEWAVRQHQAWAARPEKRAQ